MGLTLSALRHWFQRKRYLFEVTFALYMLNSTEKFICYSIVFLLASMILIAAILYLPEHISIIAGRAAFYWHGESAASAGAKVVRWYRQSRAGELAAATAAHIADSYIGGSAQKSGLVRKIETQSGLGLEGTVGAEL